MNFIFLLTFEKINKKLNKKINKKLNKKFKKNIQFNPQNLQYNYKDCQEVSKWVKKIKKEN